MPARANASTRDSAGDAIGPRAAASTSRCPTAARCCGTRRWPCSRATACCCRALRAAASRRCSARFAGIWPHRARTGALPADTMFIPQRPYLPDGRLRDALAYPRAGRRLHRRRSCGRRSTTRCCRQLARPAGRQRCLEPEAFGRRAAAPGDGARAAQAAALGVRRRGHQRARCGRRGHALPSAWTRRCAATRAAPSCRSRTAPRSAPSTTSAGPWCRPADGTPDAPDRARYAAHDGHAGCAALSPGASGRPRSGPSRWRAVRRPGSCRSRSPRRGDASRSPR